MITRIPPPFLEEALVCAFSIRWKLWFWLVCYPMVSWGCGAERWGKWKAQLWHGSRCVKKHGAVYYVGLTSRSCIWALKEPHRDGPWIYLNHWWLSNQHWHHTAHAFLYSASIEIWLPWPRFDVKASVTCMLEGTTQNNKANKGTVKARLVLKQAMLKDQKNNDDRHWQSLSCQCAFCWSCLALLD